MALKREWRINANGKEGTLIVKDANGNDVTGTGAVTGTVRFSGEPENQLEAGFWDENAKRLVFTRVIDPSNHSMSQHFTGYWFPRNHLHPEENQPQDLAGYFLAHSGTGGTPARPNFGWYATHG